VWESAEAQQKFADAALNHDMEKEAANRCVDLTQGGQPEIEMATVHRMVRAR
jgi:hypothetical protein